MSAPRFSPATLDALARYAEAQREYALGTADMTDEVESSLWHRRCLALAGLDVALDADRERAMLAADEASLVGAMVRVALANHAEDEARDCQPHRFNDVRRTMEAL